MSPLGTYQVEPSPAAQPGDPEAQVLDHPGRVVDRDGVADAVLVLHGQQDAREVVANERLGTETDGGADDRGAGQEGGEVDAEIPRTTKRATMATKKRQTLESRATTVVMRAPAREPPVRSVVWRATRPRTAGWPGPRSGPPGRR